MLLILTIPFLIAFYFLLIRPQQQRVRDHEAMVAALTVGDDVVTAGGIFGTLTAVFDDRVEIEVAPDLRLTFARAAIGRLQEPAEATLDASEVEPLDDLDVTPNADDLDASPAEAVEPVDPEDEDTP